MLKRTLRMELNKAIFSKFFAFGLALLLFMALFSAFYMIEIRSSYNPNDIEAYYMQDGKFTTNPDVSLYGFYNSWIGGEELSLAYSLFFTLLPVGAALPFGWSYYAERKSGYLKNIATRIDKKQYFACKAIAAFVSGTLVVLIPLLANILLVSAFVPMAEPFVGYTFYNHVHFGSLWADLLFTHPALYTALYVLLDGLYGGIFALLSFACAFFVNNVFLVAFLPFLSMLALGYMQGLLYAGFPDVIQLECIPTQFLHSRSQLQTTAPIVALVTIVLLGFALLTIAIRGRKDEIF